MARKYSPKLRKGSSRKLISVVNTPEAAFINIGNKSIGSDGYGYIHRGRRTIRSDGTVLVRR